MRKSIISVISVITGVIAGGLAVGKLAKKAIDEERKMSEKHLALFKMMNRWVKIKQEGKNLSSVLKKNGYKSIAIYGMSYAGKTFVEELKDMDVQIAYGIDKNADSVYEDVNIVSVEDDLGEVDAIVVTAITFFDEIEEKLLKKVNCPIISLEDILYEV